MNAQPPREAGWEHGALVSGMTAALIGVWVWAIATGPSVRRVPIDVATPVPEPDVSLVLIPVAIALVGYAVGSSLWTIVVERRLPRFRLRHGRGRNHTWPQLAATLSAMVVGRLVGDALNVWVAWTSRDQSEYVTRSNPLAAAVALTAILLTFTAVYLVGRFVMGDDDDEPEPASSVSRQAGLRGARLP